MRRQGMTRRRFLRIASLACVGTAGAALAPSVPLAAMRLDRTRHLATRGWPAMGTLVSVSAVHESRDLAEEAVSLAFAEMERLIPLFDRHDPASMISHLNTSGRLDDPEPELAGLVARAIRYSQACGGHFDPSVAPLVDVIRRKASAGEAPDSDDPDVRRAMDLADASAIETTARRVRLSRPGMALTLDGIAKGHIVDRMSRIMIEAGVHDHLVNAGGDIRTSGRRGPGSPWKIAVRDPRRSDMASAPLAFSQRCVATSGSYVVYYDREKLFHHLVDPVSGSCPSRPVSVTVAADSVMAADALSTAVFVMDPPAGLALVESMPGCECLVLGRDGSRASTRGFPRLRS